MNRPPADRSRVRTAVTYAASALLTLVLLFLAFRGIDFTSLGTELARANYFWMAPYAICLLASHLVRAWRWRYLTDPLKPAIPLRYLFSGVMVGYLMNNILPRAGELARPYALGKLASIPKSAAFGTIVIERLIDIITFLALLALVPVMYDGPLLETFPWIANGGLLLSIGTVALLGLLIVLMVRRDWTDGLLRLLGHAMPARFSARIGKLFHSFLDGVLFVKRPHVIWKIIILSGLVWFLYILMMYMGFWAFGLETQLDLRAAAVLEAISSIGVAIPTPGATGGYHAFASQTLSKLFSVDPVVALSYATVTHATGYTVTTVVGLYFLWRDSIRISEVTKEE